MCPLLFTVSLEILDIEIKEKEVIDIISSKTQNQRESINRTVKPVRMTSQVGNCL